MVTENLFNFPAPTQPVVPPPLPEVEPIITPNIQMPAPPPPVAEAPKPKDFSPRVMAKAQLVYPAELQAKQQKQVIAQATPSGAWGAAEPGR